MKKKATIIISIIITLLAWMYANNKEVENGFFPDVEQQEMQNISEHHKDKGDIEFDNGYINIKVK